MKSTNTFREKWSKKTIALKVQKKAEDQICQKF
jgi:hypothetical protein